MKMSYINALAVGATMAAMTSAQAIQDKLESSSVESSSLGSTELLFMILQEQANQSVKIDSLTAQLGDVNAELDEIMNEQVIEDVFYINDEGLSFNGDNRDYCFPTIYVRNGQVLHLNASVQVGNITDSNRHRGRIFLETGKPSAATQVAYTAFTSNDKWEYPNASLVYAEKAPHDKQYQFCITWEDWLSYDIWLGVGAFQLQYTITGTGAPQTTKKFSKGDLIDYRSAGTW